MKDSNEMARCVLERRDRYIIQKKREGRWAAAGAVCLSLAVLLGVGLRQDGIPAGAQKYPAGGIVPGGVSVEASPDPGEQMKKEMTQAAMEDLAPAEPDGVESFSASAPGHAIENLSGSETAVPPGASDAPFQGTDAPVQGEVPNTGALTAYEAVWGGSYMDEEGNWVVWLTENTPETRQKVFEQNPGLTEENTRFQTADYSLAYLTDLMAEISAAMGADELPCVSTAALREDLNRVEVTMTEENTQTYEKILALDSLGGAVEVGYSAGVSIMTGDLVKGPAE